jgi:hypothetical protein
VPLAIYAQQLEELMEELFSESASLYAEHGVALGDGIREMVRHLRARRVVAAGQVRAVGGGKGVVNKRRGGGGAGKAGRWAEAGVPPRFVAREEERARGLSRVIDLVAARRWQHCGLAIPPPSSELPP